MIILNFTTISASLAILVIFIPDNLSTFEINCPNPAQWHLCTKGFCNASMPSYVCLLDDNNNRIIETCLKQPEHESPGYRLLVRGGYDGEKCQTDKYQPFTFWTNGHSDCVFLKSKCEDEGQIYSDYGSTDSDVSCRCDNKRGYAFITMPSNPSKCHPSFEDCSCYLKLCEGDMVLAADYLCREKDVAEKKIPNFNLIKGNRPINDFSIKAKGGCVLEDTATSYSGDRGVVFISFTAILTVIICGISLKIIKVIWLQSDHQMKITSRDRSDLICSSCSRKTVYSFCDSCERFWCQTCKQQVVISGYNIVKIHCSVQICCECAEPIFDEMLEKGEIFDGKTSESPNQIRISLVSKFKLPTIYEKPVRVCGIGILADRRIVIADYNNGQMILFNNFHWETDMKLYHKPEGMSSLFGNRIAITIAVLKKILIYDVVFDRINKTAYLSLKKEISTSNTGRPCTIAFNCDHFVVKIWKNSLLNKTKNKQSVLAVYGYDGIKNYINITGKLAHFNGEISLCLKWTGRLIFVSGIDAKGVLCLDFEGNVLWEQNITSPRSIIFVPEGWNEKLLVACSCFDAVYRIDIKNGSFDRIKLPEGVTSPSFLTYHMTHKLLVVIGQNCIYTLECTKIAREKKTNSLRKKTKNKHY